MTRRRLAFLAATGLMCLLVFGCDDREASKARAERAAAEAREQAERQQLEEAKRRLSEAEGTHKRTAQALQEAKRRFDAAFAVEAA